MLVRTAVLKGKRPHAQFLDNFVNILCSIAGLDQTYSQGWKFAHRFSERIALFCEKMSE